MGVCVAGPKVAPTLLGPPPRFPPPRLLGYGDYCFRAVCFLVDDADDVAGHVTGYDRTVGIAEDVENACRLHRRGRNGVRCLPPELTLLPSGPLECSGQVYFEFNGRQKNRKV